MPVFDPLTFGSLMILAAGPGGVCDMAPKTKINVVPTALETKFVTDQSLEQLQEVEVNTIDPYGLHSQTMTQGYMQGRIKMAPSVKLNYKQASDGGVCVWYESIDIHIEIDPAIYLAKEVYDDQCMRKAVTDHEMKHINADRLVVNKYAKTVGKKIYDSLKLKGFKVGPVPQEMAQATVDRMHRTVFQLVDFEYKKMDIERQEIQQGIDSLEEYEYVQGLCPDYHAQHTHGHTH